MDLKDGEVKTIDMAGNSVTAAKIKDGEVKAPKIATDAVGAAEIAGVTKLLFGQCVLSSAQNSVNVAAGASLIIACTISGVDGDDSAVATLNVGSSCFEVAQANTEPGNVEVQLRNDYIFTTIVGSGRIGVIVYDK